ncbi:hypothetical protein NN561_019942 [Cricetulus griseus]
MTSLTEDDAVADVVTSEAGVAVDVSQSTLSQMNHRVTYSRRMICIYAYLCMTTSLTDDDDTDNDVTLAR